MAVRMGALETGTIWSTLSAVQMTIALRPWTVVQQNDLYWRILIMEGTMAWQVRAGIMVQWDKLFRMMKTLAQCSISEHTKTVTQDVPF